MTIPRLRAITAYQRENPPIHIMIAAYLDAGSKNARSSEVDSNGQSLFDILPMSPGA